MSFSCSTMVVLRSNCSLIPLLVYDLTTANCFSGWQPNRLINFEFAFPCLEFHHIRGCNSVFGSTGFLGVEVPSMIPALVVGRTDLLRLLVMLHVLMQLGHRLQSFVTLFSIFASPWWRCCNNFVCLFTLTIANFSIILHLQSPFFSRLQIQIQDWNERVFRHFNYMY